MSYSVVIPSRNVENLRHCVAAIHRHEPQILKEQIVVVDDDETGAIADFATGGACVTERGEKPFIFARNANIGIRKAFESLADVVILLNDDAMLSKRSGFTLLSEALWLAPQYGIVASSCNNVGNPSQHPRGADFIRIERRTLCFVCVAISRKTYEQVGPLDERFTAYGWEDNDYSRRVKEAGLKLGIFDGCYVDHGSLVSTFRGGATAGGDIRPGAEIYRQKWGDLN